MARRSFPRVRELVAAREDAASGAGELSGRGGDPLTQPSPPRGRGLFLLLPLPFGRGPG